MISYEKEDRAIWLMNKSSFILKAAETPELSWNSLNGYHAQIQLSYDVNFNTAADDTWYYNTLGSTIEPFAPFIENRVLLSIVL